MAKRKDPVPPGLSPSDEGRMRFVKQMFSKYYSETKVPAPSKIEQREFGVITERAGMWRHLGFPTESEMLSFLRKQVPLHAYHSSAYYQKSAARTMEEKGWLGADLIFDLDADHIKGPENMTMEEMLAAVIVQFTKLLDDFLLDDFGFSEKDIKIVFSGSRGYHAHISNKSVLKLDSHERREIVDYITNPDLNFDNLLKRETFDVKVFKGHVSRTEIYNLYHPGTPGWKGKLTRGVIRFIDRTESMSMEEIIDLFLTHKGIGDKLAQEIYASLYPGKPGERGIDKIRALNLEPFSNDKARNAFVNIVIKEIAIDMGGETDEPVTSDVKRLIRLPESIHGKTGLIVRRLGLEEYRGFIPLDDAVWKGYGDNTVKVVGLEDFEIRLAGERFKLTRDGTDELPAYAATFFACQKKCDILL